MSEYFPKAMSGRANGALALLNVGSAFVLQSATGFVIEQWPETRGAYPTEAHQVAMAIPLALQMAAAAWFAFPRRRLDLTMQHGAGRSAVARAQQTPLAPSPYVTGFPTRRDQARLARRHAARWRLAAVASMSVCVALATILGFVGSHAGLQTHTPEMERRNAATQATIGLPLWLAAPKTIDPASTRPVSTGDAAADGRNRNVNSAREN